MSAFLTPLDPATARLQAQPNPCATVTAFRIALSPGLDDHVWALSDPARSLGLMPAEGPGGFMAHGVDPASVLVVLKRDQRVISAEVAGSFEDAAHAPPFGCPQTAPIAGPGTGPYDWGLPPSSLTAYFAHDIRLPFRPVVEETRPAPGQPPLQLPGYVPKDPRTQNLTWNEKALAATPATGATSASRDVPNGLIVAGLLALGVLLLGRK